MPKLDKTPRQIRAASKRRGDIGGHLGMEEMAMLASRPVAKCDACGYVATSPELVDRFCGRLVHINRIVGHGRCQGTFRAVAGEFK